MHELIECRACQAPYCNGCNMFTLSQALHKGYFDRFMEDGHHTIYIDTLKQDRMTNADRITEAPTPHGRLIDADALLEHLGDTEYKGAVKRVLMQAPTIIEAEEGQLVTYKQKICHQIIKKMEWWRNVSWASHIDERTKNEVITVMQNVVDGISHERQKYNREEGE